MICTPAYLPGFTPTKRARRRYLPLLTASENRKGVLDVDTVKGCTQGLAAYPQGGCYGECYALKTAALYGIDFSVSVVRRYSRRRMAHVFRAVKSHRASWYRIGTAGDPCHDWDHTVRVCEELAPTGKTAVIITKHWLPLSNQNLADLSRIRCVINTSTSGMDSSLELQWRAKQMDRIQQADITSVCRVVTCEYGATPYGRRCQAIQDRLLACVPVIDNPLRCGKSNKHVISGDIILGKHPEAIGGGKSVSVHDGSVFLGHCDQCPDQCGAIQARKGNDE